MRSLRSVFFTLVSTLALATQGQAALIGLYEFDGDFSNSQGTLDSLTPVINGGTAEFVNGAWTWSEGSSPGTGLELQLPNALEEYSIGIRFSFEYTDTYRKVLDLDGLISDAGIYLAYNTIAAFQMIPSAAFEGEVAPNVITTIILTKTSTGAMAIYQDGSEVPIIHEAGSYLGALLNLTFFVDDRNGGEYSPGGTVYEIRIWDTALTAGEIPTAFPPIPEPSVYTLLSGIGLIALVAFSRARQSRQTV